MKFAALQLTSLLCVALALGGCAADVETVSPAAAGQPRFVELVVVGMIQPGTRYSADWIFATCEVYPLQAYRNGRYHGRPATRKRVTPTPARWAAFWRVVDRLDLPAWKLEYNQDDIPPDRHGRRFYVTDSLQWTTRFSYPSRTQTSRGDGASPVAGHPSSVILDSSDASRNGVLILENAFEELLKP